MPDSQGYLASEVLPVTGATMVWRAKWVYLDFKVSSLTRKNQL